MAQGWLDIPYEIRGKKLWVAGSDGMVGSAVIRRLQGENVDIIKTNRNDLDLKLQAHVHQWVKDNRPDVIVLAAARVGGIQANINHPADYQYDNLMIQANVLHAAYEHGVEKLLLLGSSCIYPKDAPQPIVPEALLSGALEHTNEAYALAKIMGVKLCQNYRAQYGCDFISAMPCNLYGVGDRFDAENSHVIPALMMKAHEVVRTGAAVMEVWGSGTPRREFLCVDDLADALVFMLKRYSGAMPVNIGAGADISIAELARMIADIAGFRGELVFNTARPDGVAAKLMDSSRIYGAGWQPQVPLEQGLRQAYEWYRAHEQRRAA